MSGTLAIDVGGTFTDITFADAATGATWVAKTPSTPGRSLRRLHHRHPQGARPGAAAARRTSCACSTARPPPPTRSSRARRRRPRSITTAGFKYVLEIGRHDIPRHGNLYGWSKPARPITPDRVFEVTERLDARRPRADAARRGRGARGGAPARAARRARGGGGLPPRLRQPRARAAHAGDPRARSIPASSCRSRPRCCRSSASSSARWPPRSTPP